MFGLKYNSWLNDSPRCAPRSFLLLGNGFSRREELLQHPFFLPFCRRRENGFPLSLSLSLFFGSDFVISPSRMMTSPPPLHSTLRKCQKQGPRRGPYDFGMINLKYLWWSQKKCHEIGRRQGLHHREVDDTLCVAIYGC